MSQREFQRVKVIENAVAGRVTVEEAGSPNLYVTDYLGPSVRRSTDRGQSWSRIDIVPDVHIGDTRLALSDARP